MLTIICGENTVGSRDYFNQLKLYYQNKGYDIQIVSPQDLVQISTLQASSPTLFGQKIVYFTENLLTKVKEKKLPEAIIIDWEEKSLYELKIPKGAKTKEFKPEASIFKLLDACYPGNLKGFLNILHQLLIDKDGSFVLNMLAKHIRNLLLVKMGEEIKNLKLWQLNKLKNQARYWPMEKIINFYDALYRIDLSIKTSSTSFDVGKSLDILACYFL